MRIDRCLSWCIYVEGECRFCGWPKETNVTAPLRIYDVAKDDIRDATQADLDGLYAVSKAYHRIRAAIDEEHGRLVREIRDIRSRAGLPHEGGV